ncbi:hypothetical protein IO99_01195 [Clostridium sulfidigenes]|uniref:Glycosylase n=1 Tax=Clostridium sulfidigenes TaxID=318464 RepID=A0A084JIM3_9CLOT|nr:hypothetical protein [Clostridium sulfidigenes]KEZ88807.1 hypothetical protein IO99_01195 [Clostridium sulfidigenes]
MKWEKIGKIFNPLNFKLNNGCQEYAQSPQALVFDDYVRIYFSSRVKSENGKWLSHVNFVDMDKSFKKVLRVSEKDVIKLGKLGSFDEHGIFPFSVYRCDGKIIAYTTGWNRKFSVSIDAGIGYAFSEDNGETFEKLGEGPILSASLEEPFLVGDAFVRKYENIYYMWYIYGSKWIKDKNELDPQRVYKIAYATSTDGVKWSRKRRNIISDKLNKNECQALPTVIFNNGKYHMIFCYREAIGFRYDKSKGYRLGYAWSSDLINWKREDERVGLNLSNKGEWDSDMMCYPNIFECEGHIYILYNGNEFGRYGFGLAKLIED